MVTGDIIDVLMCKIEDLIDISPLSQIIQTIDRGDNDEFARLLHKSLSPEFVNSKFISFTPWNFNVPETVYSSATASEVIDGWKGAMRITYVCFD
jgi:hypothetical protein